MPRIRSYNFARWGQLNAASLLKAAPDRLAIDTETPGVSWFDEPFCVTATMRVQGRLRNLYFECGEIDMMEARLHDIFERFNPSTGCEWIFHNAKFDLQKMLLSGMVERDWLVPEKIHDTEALYHLLYPNDPKGLKDLAVKWLDRGTTWVPYKSGKKKGELHKVMAEDHHLHEVRRELGLKKSDGYFLIHQSRPTVIPPYAMKDTEYTYDLFERKYPLLKDGLLDLYRTEQRVCLALLDMEAPGMGLNVKYLEEKASEFGVRLMETGQQIDQLAGEPLNPDAHEDVKTAFALRGFELEDVKAATLAKVADPLAEAIVQYRYIAKTHKTYLRGLLNEQRDGIVHPWIRQHGARTGRTASGSAQPDG